jgi:fatty-acyl-CoA synthase
MHGTMPDLPLTVTSILRHGSTVHGDGAVVTAVAPDGSTRRASYAEVGERAARLANVLRDLGVDGDQRVATLLWNNQEHLEAYLAVPALGAVLHTLNLRLFPEQLTYVANDGGDSVLVADGSLVPLLCTVLPAMTTVSAVLVTGRVDTTPLEGAGKKIVSYDDALAAASPDFAWPDLDERAAAGMCYTSGTTGSPKGVVYSHRSTYLHTMALLGGNLTAMSALDRTLPVVPMFHANAWGLPYGAFAAGADLVLPDRFLQGGSLVELISRERPTVAGAVPTIWADVLRTVRAGGGDVSSLRTVICGGAAVPRALIAGFDELGVRILHAWGMTETSPLGSVAVPPRGAGEHEMDYRQTQGRPVLGVEARIVSDDGGVLPHDGKAVGELEVRGPWVTTSYHRGEDPSRFDDGWLRTGDVGSIDPLGYISLTDRAKDVIKSGGEWISSVALENELMACPDVVEAAVVAVPDERWQERPLACVVLRDGVASDAAALRNFLDGRVARWQLPERWAFLPAVPKTSVGKFDKKVLRRCYADGSLAVVTLEPLPR